MRARLKRDPLTGALVILAPGRADRPGAFLVPAPLANPGDCPFCPGREHETPPESLAVRPGALPADTPGWSVRVVPNRYPAVTAEGFGIAGVAAGIHEVIIETPGHLERLPGLSEPAMAAVLGVYFQRLEHLLEQPGIHRALIFKNSGAHAGASLIHEHAQAIGFNFSPPDLAREERRMARHQERTGRCLACDLLGRALATNKRLVLDAREAVAFCPPAPRMAHEAWIMPREHGPPDAPTLSAMARALLAILRGLEAIAPGASFNLVLSGPEKSGSRRHHPVLKVLPRLTGLAGLECGGGLFINPVPPAASARLLRG